MSGHQSIGQSRRAPIHHPRHEEGGRIEHVGNSPLDEGLQTIPIRMPRALKPKPANTQGKPSQPEVRDAQPTKGLGMTDVRPGHPALPTVNRIQTRPQESTTLLVNGLNDLDWKTDRHRHMDWNRGENILNQHRVASQSGESSLPGWKTMGYFGLVWLVPSATCLKKSAA